MATGSLLGKADATLVKAATDAAMANVPVDVSRIHERMMKSHGRMMESIGRSWVEGITGALKVGGALVKKAIQNKATNNAPGKAWTNTLGKSEVSTDIPSGEIDGEGETIQKPEYNFTDINGNTQAISFSTIPELIKDNRRQRWDIKRNKDLSKD